MANEINVMPSVTSTLTQHGGLQAAMSVSKSQQSDGDKSMVVSHVAPAKGEKEAVVPDHLVKSINSQSDIEKQAQELQEKLANLSKLKGWTINFSLVPELEQPVIKVIDADTKQVIRQIPSEEILTISKRLEDLVQANGAGANLSGLLLNKQE